MDDPASVLRLFFVAMHEWEASCAVRDRRARSGELSYEEAKQESLEQLKVVFSKFSTNSGCPARARFGGASYSRPPEYNPDGEKILEVIDDDQHATIRTQQTTTGYNNQCQYRLTRTAAGWRIEDNRTRLSNRGEWVPWDL